MTVEYCQNVVIGSGEAGKYLAWTLAKMPMAEGFAGLFSKLS